MTSETQEVASRAALDISSVPPTIEGAFSHGMVRIVDAGVAFAVLLIFIFALLWLVRYLLLDAKDNRTSSTNALISSTAAIVESKNAINELKEMVRVLAYQKNG